eukprot:CAMPEP_0204273322 /NCGR_PEP_ID=MMETSP0468-20130131/23066_1 /ASSEMBLY_ACC=CAM_ASM_000383 /TAXON_ID=2969 /ORGANISM="Oxyrrhis marina" /LENGTH=312 /DNA_ID=CAMNT_0051249317 /DNA_START=29 /DNA_END=967 /DNA_ORIENTATION=+
MSYKMVDMQEWTGGESGHVIAFLKDILPGHPCYQHFKFTTGHVLASLSKDDLRRQARDVEAGNVIWVEMQKCKRAPSMPSNSGVAHSGSFTIFVRTPADVAIEMEVTSGDTTMQLKQRLSEVEGTPVESQRLVCNGAAMDDRRNLASYRVGHGHVLLLVPRLNSAIRSIPPTAARAQLSNTGYRPNYYGTGASVGSPSHSIRPYVPIVATDVYRPFPMNVEFDRVEEYEKFMRAVASSNHIEGDEPVLEIAAVDPNHEPVRAKVTMDVNSDTMRATTLGDIVVANSRYKAKLSVPSVPDGISITLTTGNRVA